MSLRKEIESVVAGLNVGDTFTTGSFAGQSSEVIKALNRMSCVSNTGRTVPKEQVYKGGKLPQIWEKSADLEEDLRHALEKKRRGDKMHPSPAICKAYPNKKSFWGCSILNDQYWNQLK